MIYPPNNDGRGPRPGSLPILTNSERASRGPRGTLEPHARREAAWSG